MSDLMDGENKTQSTPVIRSFENISGISQAVNGAVRDINNTNFEMASLNYRRQYFVKAEEDSAAKNDAYPAEIVSPSQRYLQGMRQRNSETEACNKYGTDTLKNRSTNYNPNDSGQASLANIHPMQQQEPRVVRSSLTNAMPKINMTGQTFSSDGFSNF